MTSEKKTPFTLDRPRYDLSTYTGRFSFFLELTDPRSLLYSNEQVRAAKEVLDGYRKTGKICESDEYMWLQKRIYESSTQVSSDELIFPLFRVAAIAPVNIPIVFAMLAMPATNVPGTIFLHWINQSYNFACNYANKPPGSNMSNTQTFGAYFLAVGSACGAAYGLGKVPAFRKFGALIPFLSTGIANVSNIGFTRMNELTEGSPTYDCNGNSLGLSKTAGQVGILQTALTRGVLVPMSCLLLPPIIISGLKSIRCFPTLPKYKHIASAIEIFVIYISLQAALPAALAIYPQKYQIRVNRLEPHLQSHLKHLKYESEYVYANKGL